MKVKENLNEIKIQTTMPKSIPKEVKTEVLQIVESYNKKNKTTFEMTFRGQFAYLSKTEEQVISDTFKSILTKKLGITPRKLPKQEPRVIVTKLGRLKYNGQIDNWHFAILQKRFSSFKIFHHETIITDHKRDTITINIHRIYL